jgi:hypothetical protein
VARCAAAGGGDEDSDEAMDDLEQEAEDDEDAAAGSEGEDDSAAAPGSKRKRAGSKVRQSDSFCCASPSNWRFKLHAAALTHANGTLGIVPFRKFCFAVSLCSH